MSIALGTAQTFLLLLLRTAAFFYVAPLFGETQITTRIRIAMAAAVSAVLVLGLGAQAEQDFTVGALCAQSIRETLIGLAGGLGARFVFEASAAAGTLAGTSMGIGFGATSSADSTAPSAFLRLLALAALVLAGVHRSLLGWLYASVRAYPLGGSLQVLPLAEACLHYGLFSLALTVRVAYPIMAAGLFGHVAMGIAGRAAPQINLQSIGFSSSILAGGAALYFAAPIVAQQVAQATISAALP